MASFEFLLIGAHGSQRVELPAQSLSGLAEAYFGGDRCIFGELPPDEWGEVRRVLIPANRVQMIVEGE